MKRVVASIAVVASGLVQAQELTVTTFAGPRELPGIADGIESDARFKKPMGIAVGPGGSVYVADEDSHTIRKVSSAGSVTTVAGLTYSQGQSDGPEHDARFSFPRGVATDGAGNLYVADTFNNMIRKITPAGVVSTIAGFVFPGSADGVGRAARFEYPAGIAAWDDTLYVADTLNHTIRKVMPDGSVRTIAGTPRTPGATNGVAGTARFYNPGAIAVGPDGALYVADTWNHAIRKVTPEGMVSTFCGAPGTRGSATGACAAARFAYPSGLAFDHNGDLYVADTFNFCIRRITPSGQVFTVAGVPEMSGADDGPAATSLFDQPQGIAVDALGSIYVSELSNATIRKISDGHVSTIAGVAVASGRGSVDGTREAARFGFIGGIASDASGTLFVTDYANATVRKVSRSAEVVTIAGRSGVSGTADGAAHIARFGAPRGIAADHGSNVFVADSENHSIRRIAPDGTVSTFAGVSNGEAGHADGRGAAARFNYPWGLATDAAGNVYVADSRNHAIRKVTPDGSVSTLAGSPGSAGHADGIGTAARFNDPHAVAVDATGSVYVADTNNHVVRKISAGGEVTTLAGLANQRGYADGHAGTARFARPSAIAVDAEGNVYVGDASNTSLRKIDHAGEVTTVAGRPGGDIFVGALEGPGTADGTGGEAQFQSLGGLTFDGSGNLYVADAGTIRLARPTIPDTATIAFRDAAHASVQLGVEAGIATEWEWRVIRRPADARAALSASSIREPIFTPDVAGMFIFRLTAAGPSGARISHVYFISTTTAPVPTRRRSVRH